MSLKWAKLCTAQKQQQVVANALSGWKPHRKFEDRRLEHPGGEVQCGEAHQPLQRLHCRGWMFSHGVKQQSNLTGSLEAILWWQCRCSRWRKLCLKTLWSMEEVATEGRLLIDQHLRPFKLISFPRSCALFMLTHIDAIFSQDAYLRSTRCYPTIITWRSQQRSQLYRPRPDTRKVFRTDTHREQTHNRREWTDRLEEDNRRDKIRGTQILILENIAYILVEFNLFTYILKSISLVEDAASTTL